MHQRVMCCTQSPPSRDVWAELGQKKLRHLVRKRQPNVSKIDRSGAEVDGQLSPLDVDDGGDVIDNFNKLTLLKHYGEDVLVSKWTFIQGRLLDLGDYSRHGLLEVIH